MTAAAATAAGAPDIAVTFTAGAPVPNLIQVEQPSVSFDGSGSLPQWIKWRIGQGGVRWEVSAQVWDGLTAGPCQFSLYTSTDPAEDGSTLTLADSRVMNAYVALMAGCWGYLKVEQLVPFVADTGTLYVTGDRWLINQVMHSDLSVDENSSAGQPVGRTSVSLPGAINFYPDNVTGSTLVSIASSTIIEVPYRTYGRTTVSATADITSAPVIITGSGTVSGRTTVTAAAHLSTPAMYVTGSPAPVIGHTRATVTLSGVFGEPDEAAGTTSVTVFYPPTVLGVPDPVTCYSFVRIISVPDLSANPPIELAFDAYAQLALVADYDTDADPATSPFAVPA